jgi:hypothetical protein
MSSYPKPSADFPKAAGVPQRFLLRAVQMYVADDQTSCWPSDPKVAELFALNDLLAEQPVVMHRYLGLALSEDVERRFAEINDNEKKDAR